MKRDDRRTEAIERLTQSTLTRGARLPGASRLRVMRYGENQPTEARVVRPDCRFPPAVPTFELCLG
jgi:hypothetical protein